MKVMKKLRTSPYLFVAATFGIVGIAGLAAGRPELLAFIALAVVFLAVGDDENRKRRTKRGTER